MKYLHPDVLDNGLTYLRDTAVRAIMVPNPTTDYAEVTLNSLSTAVISASDFTLSDIPSGAGGRRLTFNGKAAAANTAAPAGSSLHLAFTDGVSRVLWLESIATKPAIINGQQYILPTILSFPQPE